MSYTKQIFKVANFINNKYAQNNPNIGRIKSFQIAFNKFVQSLKQDPTKLKSINDALTAQAGKDPAAQSEIVRIKYSLNDILRRPALVEDNSFGPNTSYAKDVISELYSYLSSHGDLFKMFPPEIQVSYLAAKAVDASGAKFNIVDTESYLQSEPTAQSTKEQSVPAKAPVAIPSEQERMRRVLPTIGKTQLDYSGTSSGVPARVAPPK